MSTFANHCVFDIKVNDAGNGLFEVKVCSINGHQNDSFMNLTTKYEMLLPNAPLLSIPVSNSVTHRLVTTNDTPSLQWINSQTGLVIMEDVGYILGKTYSESETIAMPTCHLPSFPLLGTKNTISHLIRKQGGATADRFYGLGEVSGPLNHNGRKFLLKPSDSMGYDAELSDPLYKHIPFTVAYSPTANEYYGIYYCCGGGAACEVDYGHSLNNYLGSFWRTTIEIPSMPTSSQGEGQDDNVFLRYFFIHGPTLADVVTKFTTRLIGTTVPAPLWALGYLGSAMGYTDAPNAQKALVEEYLAKCAQERIITSGFHLSSGYCMSQEGLRYVFHWNTQRVPDPVALCHTFRSQHVRLIANIKPAMLESHPLYAKARDKGLFITEKADPKSKPFLTLFWGGSASYLDFTNPATVTWWKELVKSTILAKGITSTWNDNNEYVGVEGYCHGGVPTAAVRQLQSLLMTRASVEAQEEYSTSTSTNETFSAHATKGINVEGRDFPFAITRCGVTGHSRIASTWSGDNYTSWKTLKYNIFMGLGLSLSGWGNIGHDVGGFSGPQPSAELLFRWVQQGIMMPRFTIHSWKLDKPETSPWMFGEPWTSVFRSLISLRDLLTPTIFSLLMASHLTGEPFLRPRIYHEDVGLPQKKPIKSGALPEEVEDQGEGHSSIHNDAQYSYYFGSKDILVFPIVEHRQHEQIISLPLSSTGWYRLGSETLIPGNQNVSVLSPIPTTQQQEAPNRTSNGWWPIVFLRGGSQLLLKKTDRNKDTFALFEESAAKNGIALKSLKDFMPPPDPSPDGASEAFELHLWTAPSLLLDAAGHLQEEGDQEDKKKRNDNKTQWYLPINDHTTHYISFSV